MARYRSSGIISGVRGSMGDTTFAAWHGVPYIKRKNRKSHNSGSAKQIRIRERWGKLVNSYWHELSFSDWALWEDYARRVSVSSTGSKRIGLMNRIGNSKMTGCNAYTSLNQLLMVGGFSSITRPPHPSVPKPAQPLTDLIDCGTYRGEVRFNIWLASSYDFECICYVWGRLIHTWSAPHICALVPISTTPAEVVIAKISIKKGKRIVEEKLSSFSECKLLLQFRVVSSKGTYSLPTPIYKMQVKN